MTAMAKLMAAAPDTATLAAMEPTVASICDRSDASTLTGPAASTKLPLVMPAVTELVVVLTISAPAPAPEREKLPLPAKETAVELPKASMVASPMALTSTTPPLSTVEDSMSAAVLPPTLFSASVTDTEKLMAALPDALTLTAAAITSEEISEVSLASSVTALDASTWLPSAMTAWVAPVIVLLAFAPEPLMAPAMEPDADTATETAAVVTSMVVSESASISTEPVGTSSREFSTPAVTSVPTVFSASAIAADTPNERLPLAEMLTEPANVVASMSFLFVAFRVTLPPAETCWPWAASLSRMTASTAPFTVFSTWATVTEAPTDSEPEPATERAAATPVTSILAVERARTFSAPPAAAAG